MNRIVWPNQHRARSALRIAPTRRHLQYEDGAPFFWLGDTAWRLFGRLNLDEARHYLSDRAAKGFTVVQAVLLADMLSALAAQNANGDTSLIDGDITRPNETYFRHVDAIVAEAAARGLLMALFPNWGRHFSQASKVCVLNPDNAAGYGRFLGQRYREQPVVWVLGGDHNPENDTERGTIAALAGGLREGHGGRQLHTYHPCGPGRSSDWFHEADWLDFNMYQSSHAAHGFDNGIFAEHDLALHPPKPTLDGEPRYETIPVGFYFKGNNPADRFTDLDARQGAYASLLAGACGHTYGENHIWQMWAPAQKPEVGGAVPWWQALNHPGAFQMTLVRRLFESRPWQLLRPAQHMLVDAPRQGPAKVRAALAMDRRFAFVYSPRGEPFTVDVSLLAGIRVRQTWFDPRYGINHTVQTGVKGALTFTPPTASQDWVLVLDDEAAGFSAPGDWPPGAADESLNPRA